MRLETTSSTVHRRGGNPGEKMVREMLEEQIVPERKDNQRGRGSGTPVRFRLGRKELRLGGNKREGGRERGEGGSIPTPPQGQVLLPGLLRRPPAVPDLCSCRTSLSAGPCADNREEARAQRERMGQEAVLMSGVQAPRNHQRQLLQSQTQHLPLPCSTCAHEVLLLLPFLPSRGRGH